MRAFALLLILPLLFLGTPLTYANHTTSPVDAACMQAAIDTRDFAIVQAGFFFVQSWASAIDNRRNALRNAWFMTDREQRRDAINAAWRQYKDAKKAARENYNRSRKDIWRSFSDRARDVCHARGTEADRARERNDSL